MAQSSAMMFKTNSLDFIQLSCEFGLSHLVPKNLFLDNDVIDVTKASNHYRRAHKKPLRILQLQYVVEHTTVYRSASEYLWNWTK